MHNMSVIISTVTLPLDIKPLYKKKFYIYPISINLNFDILNKYKFLVLYTNISNVENDFYCELYNNGKSFIFQIGSSTIVSYINSSINHLINISFDIPYKQHLFMENIKQGGSWFLILGLDKLRSNQEILDNIENQSNTIDNIKKTFIEHFNGSLKGWTIENNYMSYDITNKRLCHYTCNFLNKDINKFYRIYYIIDTISENIFIKDIKELEEVIEISYKLM